MKPSDAFELALRECAREPIQHSGAIQPSGYLLACTRHDWRIAHVSANCAALFGAEAGALIGLPLRELLEDQLVDAIARTAAGAVPGQPPVQAGAGNLGPGAQAFDLGVHVADDLVQVEIEPAGAPLVTAAALSQAMIARLVDVDDEDEFHRRVAEQVRALTGYDRVMVYRFLHDDTGDVIAEARAPDITGYLGVRFPASDIPPQARALYLRNRVRVIADVDYVPVPLLPPTRADGAPLDLSQHALRSVSPIHLAYLRNMDVAASMSVSIIVDGRLWGLIACHHRQPRNVAPPVRGAADLFGMFVSMRIAARELQRDARYQDRANAARDELEARIVSAPDTTRALETYLSLLQRAVPCEGVALWHDGQWMGSGRIPEPAVLEQVRDWSLDDGTPLRCADSAAEWRGADDGGDGLAGVLTLRTERLLVALFRHEQLEDVRWAGRPDAPFQLSVDGRHLGPRESFATWREIARGAARPWTSADRSLAERLRLMLLHRERARSAAKSDTAIADARVQNELAELRERMVQLIALVDGLTDVDAARAEQLASHTAQVQARVAELLQKARH